MKFSSFTFALSLSVAVLATAWSASAQDYGSTQKADFSGAYVGANIGVASRKMPNITSGASLTGGVQAGFNYQAGAFVAGAELDLGHAGGQRLRTDGGSLRQDWNGAAKLKAGIALDQTMIYGTGGFGLGKMRGPGSTSNWEEAKILGGGMEHIIGGGKSLKVEYQRARFNDVNTPAGGTADITSHAIRAGMNMRF